MVVFAGFVGFLFKKNIVFFCYFFSNSFCRIFWNVFTVCLLGVASGFIGFVMDFLMVVVLFVHLALGPSLGGLAFEHFSLESETSYMDCYDDGLPEDLKT